MTQRLVVIGADAAGMSAASQAVRMRSNDLDVVAFERGNYSSYSACGIPYWVAGDVASDDDLVVRSPAEHRARGIDLRMRHEVVGVDLDRREVEVRSLDDSRGYQMSFDQLVLATGARPLRPDLPGIDGEGVYGIQTLDDGRRVLDGLRRDEPKSAVVIGGGYIGLEMAEALLRKGLRVTVVDQAPEPMGSLDPDMGKLVREAMEKLGLDVRVDTPVERLELDAGRVRAVIAGDATLPADVVVLGLGVAPETALARAAGLPLGDSGGVRVDPRMAVAGHEGVWAGGDCVETFHRVSQSWTHVPLGTHANKHGLVIGTNIGGGDATFPGVVGTAMTKVCDLEVARTGLHEAQARQAGFDVETVVVESSTRAGYFPGARQMTVKMVVERRTGRLLGAQIVGGEGSAKRIDVCAVALWNDMTVDEVIGLDLGYAPPFSPVWDPVLVAARKAAEVVRAGGS